MTPRGAVACALAASLTASCAPAAPRADSTQLAVATGETRSERTRWAVSPRHIGPVRIGMSLDSIASVLGLIVTDITPRGRMCAYVRPPNLPAGVSLLFVHDTLVRVDVDSTDVLTEEGVGVGDSEVGLLVRYAGNIRVEAHGVGSHTLHVSRPSNSTYVLTFETNGNLVQRYKAGRRSVTQAAARCSA
ncbi:MAG: hypothetical protein ABI969_01675 [bacterium]